MTAELRNRIAELRRRRRWLPPVAAIGSTLAVLAATIGYLSLPLTPTVKVATAPLAYLVIGFMQYRLVLASHEATHKTLFHPVWLNEAVGLLSASLVGVSLFNYRRAHLEHHKYPQSIQDDIDGYIYRPLIQARAGWRRFALLFVGNYADILTKLRRKFLGDGNLEGTHALAGSQKPRLSAVATQLAPIAAVQLAVWALWWWQVGWWSYFVFWLLPIFTVALQLDRIRTFLEHGYHYFYPGPPNPDLSQAPQSTIDVETSFLERYLFAPFGFSDHQAHHAQLTVPFYNLPILRDLLEAEHPGYVRRIRASYVALLVRMIRAEAPSDGMQPAEAALDTNSQTHEWSDLAPPVSRGNVRPGAGVPSRSGVGGT